MCGSYVGALFYVVYLSVGIPCNHLAVEEKLDCFPSCCQCVLLSQLCVTSSWCLGLVVVCDCGIFWSCPFVLGVRTQLCCLMVILR